MASTRSMALLVLTLIISPSVIITSASSLPTINEVETGNSNNLKTKPLGVNPVFTGVFENKTEAFALRLTSHVENVMEKLEEAFEKFEDEIPEKASYSYELGVKDLESAFELLGESNYTGSSLMAHQALRHFSEAFKSIRLLIAEEQPLEEPGYAEKKRGLKVAIDRAKRYLDRISPTLQNFADSIEGVSEINEKLEGAGLHLDYASGNLSVGEYEVAQREFSEARRMLGNANALIHKAILENKKVKAVRYMELVQARIRDINGTLRMLRERLEEGQIERVRMVLITTSKRLNTLKERLRRYSLGEDIEEDLDEIEESVEDIEEILEKLDGQGIGLHLRSIGKVHAWIQVMNMTIMRLSSRGEDSSNMEERIREAERLMEEAKERLRQGKADELRDLLEDVEEQLEGARERIQNALSDWNEEFRNRFREKLRALGVEED